MQKEWSYQRFQDGRFFASNGQVDIYAISLDSRNRLIRKYRHFKGIISQSKDGTVKEMAIA